MLWISIFNEVSFLEVLFPLLGSLNDYYVAHSSRKHANLEENKRTYGPGGKKVVQCH